LGGRGDRGGGSSNRRNCLMHVSRELWGEEEGSRKETSLENLKVISKRGGSGSIVGVKCSMILLLLGGREVGGGEKRKRGVRIGEQGVG